MRETSRMDAVRMQAAEVLGIPKDVVLKEPIITITGRRHVYIENYERILRIEDQEIRLQAKTCKLLVSGKRLRIEYYTKDDMLISGLIQMVSAER